MNTSLVLTVSGVDRPGLVDRLAQRAAEHGANWEESRMARLAGHFVGLVHLTCADSRIEGLVAGLDALRTEGLTVLVARGIHNPLPGPARSVTLTIVCNDRVGVVRDVSHTLASLGVNIDQLTTDTESAAHVGGLIFRATARLTFPTGTATAQLREALERMGNDLMVDIREED